MKKIIIIYILLLTGCIIQPRITNKVEDSKEETLVRLYDRDNSVICYRSFGREGISCLKIEEK